MTTRQPHPNETNGKLKRFREERARDRARISLLRAPIRTLTNFGFVAQRAVRHYLRALLTHPVAMYGLAPALLVYLVLNNIDGAHQSAVTEGEEWIAFAVWWVGLGVLSSIGLGTGLHTGMLFLFPYIFKVCMAATECGTTAFDARSDMWMRQSETAFLCPETGISGGSPTFRAVWLKAVPAAFLWGVGTAIGEIPPYLVSRGAALAGKEDEEFNEMMHSKSSFAALNRMKEWMIDFLQRHGFIGVLLMASWPNMAFDLCGICCGHFLMPFWTFFGATLIGKAFIKVTGQTAFFVLLFQENGLERIVRAVDWVFPDNYEPCKLVKGVQCHELVRTVLQKVQSTFRRAAEGEASSASGSVSGSESGGTNWLKAAWGWVMVLFIGYFVVSCIEQFARSRQKEIDDKQIENMRTKECRTVNFKNTL